MDALIYSAVIILAFLGVSCVAKYLVDIFYKSKCCEFCMFTIIPVKKEQDIEFAVRSVLWNKNWEELAGQRILLVLKENDDDTKSLCKKLCEEYEPVNMCYPYELEKIVDDPFIKIYK